jgi:hypothetical protein
MDEKQDSDAVAIEKLRLQDAHEQRDWWKWFWIAAFGIMATVINPAIHIVTTIVEQRATANAAAEVKKTVVEKATAIETKQAENTDKIAEVQEKADKIDKNSAATANINEQWWKERAAGTSREITEPPKL